MAQQKKLSAWLMSSTRTNKHNVVSKKRSAPPSVANSVSSGSTTKASDRPNVAKRRKVKDDDDDAIGSQTRNHVNVVETRGDLFDRPANAMLVHACNTQGSWGAGIAKAFHQRYPDAFDVYARHCREAKAKQSSLVGTALLIAPPRWDSSRTANSTTSKPKLMGPSHSKSSVATGNAHFVGCLFTSRAFGKRKDSPEQILDATELAMEDLLRQVKKWNEAHGPDAARQEPNEPEAELKGNEKVSKGTDSDVNDQEQSHDIKSIHMCKINSGLFAVPWEDTRAVLESIDLNQILSTDGEHDGDARETEHTVFQTIEVVSPG